MSNSTMTVSPLEQRANSDKWWHLSFGGLLTVTLIVFFLWSFDYVGPNANKLMLITTIVFGVFMAFNICLLYTSDAADE